VIKKVLDKFCIYLYLLSEVCVMAKKHFDLVLDDDAMAALDSWLQAAGFTRSGFINTMVVKLVDAMELKSIPDYSKMTIPQLFKMAGGIGKIMEGKK